MTNYTDLIARLRNYDRCTVGPQEAAAALEAQARRIAELEYMNNSILSANNELGFAFTERDEARARIAELKAALKPFAFDYYQENDRDDDSGEVFVKIGDLRAARAAYTGADLLHPTTSEKSVNE